MQAAKSAHLDRIKSAANGQWSFIVSTIGRIPADALDGKHHPCPSGRCSSQHDAFRVFDDFSRTGGCVCNQCGKHSDGFATLQWLTGQRFPEVVGLVGSLLGIDPDSNRTKQPADPAYNLKWIDWNDSLASIWCLRYKPIIPEAIKLSGGKMAIYRDKYTVIALPVWLGHRSNIVGWRIWNVRGKLPKYSKEKEKGKPPKVEWVKSKLTYGSQPGVVGKLAADAVELWKCEGETDMLALLSINPRASAICNANGCGESPAKFNWLKDTLGKTFNFYVVHDADQPGQEGAERWSKHFSAILGSKYHVANVELPYPIQATKGKDLRDWLVEGNRYESLVLQAEKFAAIQSLDKSLPEESEDDPHRLARVNLEQYERDHDGRLLFWRDEWWKYKAGCYKKIAKEDFRSKLNAAIRREFERCWRLRQENGGDEAKQPIKKVSEALVSNVIGATKSMTTLSFNIEMPCWLTDRSRRNYLSMKNGLLNLDAVFAGESIDDCLLGHSPHWFSPLKLEYGFDVGAECLSWNNYLDFICNGDEEKHNLLQEWAGYLLWPHSMEQKFLVFEGDGGTGKSSFFAAMTAMLGDDNISSLSLEDFAGTFNLQTTIGKVANIAGDVGSIQGPEEAILKRYTGGDKVTMQRKNISEIAVRPSAKLMFAWNERPKFRDKSFGLWRRMILIPLNRRIPDDSRNKEMVSPRYWLNEAGGIMNWALIGLGRLLQQGGFSRCRVVDEALSDYRTEVNPVLEFFQDFVEVNSEESIKSDLLYKLYQNWCEASGHRAMNSRGFGKQVLSQTKAERVQKRDSGFRVWAYQGIGLTEAARENVSEKELF